MSDVTQHKDKSAEWLAWRNLGIGSSDAPVICGVSPYMTPYQLWEQKTGRAVKAEKNQWAMNKGNELEPIARAHYELDTGLEMKAQLFEHYEHRFMRASFDGYNEQAKKGIEIKYQGKEVHLSGVVPEKYMPQIQHQLYVSGCDSIDFISYNPDCEIKMIVTNVKPDIEWLSNYILIALEFWNENVIGGAPPKLLDKDVKVVKDKSGLSSEYVRLSKVIEEAETAIADIKRQILEEVSDIARVQFGIIKITKVWRVGNVDYKKIPELKDVDLEKYRGKSSFSHRIST